MVGALGLLLEDNSGVGTLPLGQVCSSTSACKEGSDSNNFHVTTSSLKVVIHVMNTYGIPDLLVVGGGLGCLLDTRGNED